MEILGYDYKYIEQDQAKLEFKYGNYNLNFSKPITIAFLS